MDKDQFYQHCMQNANHIYVRAKGSRGWDAYSLQELDNESREYWIDRWFREGRMPIMVKN